MKLTTASIPLVLGSLALLAPAASAQLTFPSAFQISPKKLFSSTYRLDGDSMALQGCFDPCDCLLELSPNFRGTFDLRRVIRQDPSIQTYAVTEVNWRVSFGGQDVRVTGSGSYAFSAAGQSLVLDLSLDGAPAQTFDSGLVPGGVGGNLPEIDITIDMADQFCFDTVFVLSAKPVPRNEITPYALRPSADFITGCIPPCLCPALIQDVRGTFGLVRTSLSNTSNEFAVVDVEWNLTSFFPQPGDLPVPVTGAGFYRATTTPVSPPMQELELDLSIGDSAPRFFTSGEAPGGSNVPLSIEVDIGVNGFQCFDEIFSVNARRLY